MSNVSDALVYASISNSVKTTVQGIDAIVNYAGSRLSSTNILPTLDNIMTNTNIKRACCLGSNNIAVRIPLPKEVTFDVITDKNTVAKKFGYYDKVITVPKTLCPAAYDRFTKPTDPDVMNNCDMFYSTYCNNAINDYNSNNTALGKTFDTNEFINFKSECACMLSPKYYGLDGKGINIIPKCLYPACSAGQFATGQVWLDQASRGVGDCNIVLCNSTTNFDNITAGGNVYITNKINQECGTKITTPTTTPTPTPTPVPVSPTPTPVPVSPTPIPVAPTPTPVPVSPTPTPVPVSPTPTSVPVSPSPTSVPVSPTTPPATTGSSTNLKLLAGGGIMLCICLICICLISLILLS
jgi:hypothetical protein